MGADGSSRPKVRGVALQSFPLENSTFPDNQAGTSRFVAVLCCHFVPSLHLLSCDLHACVCVCLYPALLNQIYQARSLSILRTISQTRPTPSSEATKVTGPDAACFSCYTRAWLTWWWDRLPLGNYHITFPPADIWSFDNVPLMGNAYEGSDRWTNDP